MSKSSRRDFLSQVAGAAAAASLPQILKGQTAPPSASSARKPNVLFIMSDDMRVELGCYNSMFGVKSPHLDALAKTGVRFDRNYCQFPLCNPSRTSMLTGHKPTTTQILGNGTNSVRTHPEYISLPKLFKQHGYATARSGKIFHGGFDDAEAWGEGGGSADGGGEVGGHRMEVQRAQIPRPSDGVIPPPNPENSQAAHSDQIILLDGDGEGNPDFGHAKDVIGYLNKYKDQPFFIGCGFSKPHSPPAAPKKFFDMYPAEQIKLTPDFAAWPTVPPGFPSAAIRPRNADLFINRGASESEAKEVIRAYIASISWVDENVGRVLAELDRLGLRDNTIIVFNVDHGYQLGEKGKWSKAGSLFEMGTRVPLFICAPGAKGNGGVCMHTVESLDIYKTICDLCGLTPPAGTEGQSMRALLENPQSAWDKPAFSVWSEDGRTLHGVAVRTAAWRYAEFGANGQNGAMLFDVVKDPLEMKNLADDPQYAKVRAELSPLVRQYAATMGSA